jgi:hypothetical protein
MLPSAKIRSVTVEIIIKLTKEQAEKLSEVLWDTQDEGPCGEGWASDELSELRGIVDAALELGGA